MYPNRNGKFSNPRDTKNNARPQPSLNRSLFPSYDSYLDAERLVIGIVNGKIGSPKRGPDGSILYSDVLDIIDVENLELKFMGYEHVVEVFLRHYPYMFSLDGDSLIPTRPSGAGKEIEPPEFLYFGTVFGVAAKVYSKGLQSKRHPFIILQTSMEEATVVANNFSRTTNDKAVVITINAKQAHTKGVKFLLGNREGQIMAEHVSRGFLKFDPRIMVEIDSALGAARI